MPELTWFRDGEEIESGDYLDLISLQSDVDYDTEGTLKMKKALSEHRGVYRIEARNKVGIATHEFGMEGKSVKVNLFSCCRWIYEKFLGNF